MMSQCHITDIEVLMTSQCHITHIEVLMTSQCLITYIEVLVTSLHPITYVEVLMTCLHRITYIEVLMTFLCPITYVEVLMTSFCHGNGVLAGEDDVVPVLGVVRHRVTVLSTSGVQVWTVGEKSGLRELSERPLENNWQQELNCSHFNLPLH